MLVEKITSRHNPLIKRFRRVRAGGERPRIFIEGARLIEDALGADAHFESVAFTAEFEGTERGAALVDLLQRVPCRGALVSKQVMEAIADTKTPQGVAAIVTRPYFELDDLFSRGPDLLVVADELQDPGNLGTIIRTAEAAGAKGLITTRFTVDPFNDKAIRSSMGSALRLPLVTGAARRDVFSKCRESKLRIIGSVPETSLDELSLVGKTRHDQVKIYTEIDLTGPIAILVGREAEGISTEAAMQADEFAHIPMAEGVESLNVAAATTVLLYEAARQRRFRFKRDA
ncbi:MAG TPA: RNA methyltransferase [Blastocatellia bacterium]|nr:RNA methyltransferase [Blastocatellia bacterium]